MQSLSKILALPVIGLTLFAGACTHNTQTTSGADYLKRYQQGNYKVTATASSIDLDIMNIAAIEPNLRFPARIGLARIENGRLTSVPADEAVLWQDMAERQGDRYGEFVPVSPLIASMVRSTDKSNLENVVNTIRKGAARQHVDYVLTYEVIQVDARKSNALRTGDLTVLGLFILPSREIKVSSTASALLLDVRNGYPYATATAFSEDKGTSTFAGRHSKQDKLSERGRLEAVKFLTTDIENALRDLKDASYEQLVAEGY